MLSVAHCAHLHFVSAHIPEDRPAESQCGPRGRPLSRPLHIPSLPLSLPSLRLPLPPNPLPRREAAPSKAGVSPRENVLKPIAV